MPKSERQPIEMTIQGQFPLSERELPGWIKLTDKLANTNQRPVRAVMNIEGSPKVVLFTSPHPDWKDNPKAYTAMKIFEIAISNFYYKNSHFLPQ